MPVAKIQLGQVWRLDETGDHWLVTKVYSEAFATYAMLRKVDGSPDDVRRVKVGKSPSGIILSGFTFAQESEEF